MLFKLRHGTEFGGTQVLNENESYTLSAGAICLHELEFAILRSFRHGKFGFHSSPQDPETGAILCRCNNHNTHTETLKGWATNDVDVARIAHCHLHATGVCDSHKIHLRVT